MAPRELTLHTAHGPVDLRSKRPKVSFVLDGDRRQLTIGNGWLRGQGEEMYHKAIKQAMLIAVEDINLADVSDPQFKSTKAVSPEQIQLKRQMLISGSERVVVGLVRPGTLQQVEGRDGRSRDLLVKFSKRFLPEYVRKRERSFVIDNGELLVYRGAHKNSKLKADYKLKDAECSIETRAGAAVPRWEEGYQGRMRVDFKERIDQGKDPLYLYTVDEAKLQRWKRAFRLAKVLVVENDRRSLKTAIVRATSGSLSKAWEALVAYRQEIDATRTLVKTMAMRLMKVEMSRGWNKFRLVQRKREEANKKRNAQRIMAARFMSEKLGEIGKTKAKAADDVREQVITRIQQKFRRYREDMIYDRMYPLGSSTMSRIQQAKLGQNVDFSYNAWKCDDALRIGLVGEALESWERDKDILNTRKSTYSEVKIPIGTAVFYVSDNLASLSFGKSSEDGDAEAYAALNKADWSKFVNVDRISSVVLHTEPVQGAALAKDGDDDGVWCTINGPRLGWDKTVVKAGKDHRVLGSQDGFHVPNALTKAGDVKWVNLKVVLRGGTFKIERGKKPKNQQDDPDDMEEEELLESQRTHTYAVMHVLGYAFRSGVRSAWMPSFNLVCEAAVPVASEDFVSLNDSEVAVEIYELTRVESEDDGEVEEHRALLFTGVEKLAAIYGAQEGKDLAHKLRTPVEAYNLRVARPHDSHEKSVAHVTISIDAEIRDSRIEKESRMVHLLGGAPGGEVTCVSPELMGGGVPTSLFTSHRGAWYDPQLGPGKFRVDHVANFVELSIGTLRFPKDDEPSDETVTFRIRALMHGFSTMTPALHRPKKAWVQVLGPAFGDPCVVKFQGTRLFLPLPPGCWVKGMETRRLIELQVLRCKRAVLPEVTFKEFMESAAGSRSRSVPTHEKELPVYSTILKFDHRMLVDAEKQVSAFLTKADAGTGVNAPTPVEVNVFDNLANTQGSTDGVLNVDFALRDRDYVKAAMGRRSNRRALCVGDKAMLTVEEPFLYPSSAAEFRRRFCNGQFNPKKQDWDTGGKGAPLRDPCLSSEYQESGLGELVPPTPFKQAFIPTFCSEIIPHKFLLLPSEKQHLDKHMPGIYHRILDSMVESSEVQKKGRMGVQKHVVNHLTHMNRQVSVTLLAMYADGTCDLELASTFIESWQGQPTRRLTMPGLPQRAEEYFVDDRELKQKDRDLEYGVPYRLSKTHDDVDHETPLMAGGAEKWKNTVLGLNQGDEWVKVGSRYLPMKEKGRQVLFPMTPLNGQPLKIKIVSASNLRNADWMGKSDPFCTVEIQGKDGTKKKTKTINGSLEPVWNEELEIPGYTPGDTLVFTVWDDDFPKQPDLLGRVRMVSQHFYPEGFGGPGLGGDLLLSEAGQSRGQASLKVKIAPVPTPPATPRTVLKRVKTSLLTPVHYMGINVYDAALKSTEGVFSTQPPANNFNPREETFAEYSKKGFAVACGPLPPDASASSCQYEWSIRLRLPNEYEMNQFVAMIRRCMRLDHYQQSSKMIQYQQTLKTETVLSTIPQRPSVGGQLDVVLVEARRLLPKQTYGNKLMNADVSALSYHAIATAQQGGGSSIRAEKPVDEKYLPELMGTTSGEIPQCTPDGSKISTYVNFRMLHNMEVVPYKGQRVQMSPILSGTDSPNWSKAAQLQASGGWTFRTGNIDPDRLPELIIDFEVMQAGVGYSSRIGAIQLPVTQRQFLTNPNEPFKNLWLPLVSIKDDRPVTNLTGEIHIMTRWLPAEKMQTMADGTQKQQLSVRSHFLKELWPKTCAQRLREPIYNIEAHYLRPYNPNLVRPRPDAPKEKKNKPPEAYKDYFARHAEELVNTVPYLECLERRQLQAWEEFESFLNENEYSSARFGERRLVWIRNNEQDKLTQLQDLIQNGIPSSMRERIWSELTLSNRIDDREGADADGQGEGSGMDAKAAEEEYLTLLERGAPQRSEAMNQLKEDAFSLASWESSTPPIPDVFDLHLKRLKQAQNVCTALIATQDTGITYCESLLILAFFLLLPQGCKEEKEPDDGNLHRLSESSAFWLLYTLICSHVNGAYREYFGIHSPAGEGAEPGYSQRSSLCAGSGAMHDVTLLECCLAYHENLLWQKLNALGFHLATVFYGAFMRLYATYMPTATVFRFWDILFALSTDPNAQPHSRAYLIDLAFGIIRCKKVELMACESALEAKTLILGVLGALYDVCTVVDITVLSHKLLWTAGGFGSGKVSYLWTQKEDLFRGINVTITEQNEVLKQLTHNTQLRLANNSSAQAKDVNVAGVTTKVLLKDIIPVILQSIENLRPRKPPQNWAMFRPMPLATNVMCESAFDKAMHLFNSTLRMHPHYPPNPYLVRPPQYDSEKRDRATTGLEPFDITGSDIGTVFERDMPAWAQHHTALWNAFTTRRDRLHMGLGGDDQQLGHNPHAPVRPSLFQSAVAKMMGYNIEDELRHRQGLMANPGQGGDYTDDHISLNELFIALICASKGTIGEKASALFGIYCYSDPMHKEMHHMTPVSNMAKSITSTMDTAGEVGKALAPPDAESEEALQNVLRLKVMTNHPHHNTKLGDCFVLSLSSCIGTGGEDTQPQIYNIWGPPPEAHRGKAGGRSNTNFSGNTAGSSSAASLGGQGPGPVQVCLGEICMAITWVPKSIRKPEEGQLCINLRYVRFFSLYVSDFFKINPWVEVQICKEEPPPNNPKAPPVRRWHDIPRWDPRGLLNTSQHQSWLTTHGAYGGVILFDQTMKDSLRGTLFGNNETFHQHWRDSKGMGFDATTKQWQWNEVWGLQRSVENLGVMPEFVRLSQRKNVMDMSAVRIIVASILQRSQLNVTNRQAIVLADSVFNRQGAVPGFLEAVLVQGGAGIDGEDTYKSLQLVKEECRKQGKKIVDVTYQIVREHEKQISMNGGLLNLFTLEYFARAKQVEDPQEAPIRLKDMAISDPFPGQRKTLYIRYVRGGDGERCTSGVPVSPNGDIIGPEVMLDQQDMWPQTKVTKDEFVSCMLDSPLLGESLRRLGACDHFPAPKKSIPLGITILDPHHEEEEQQIADMMDVQQSILFEVWDSDALNKEFLGEAWLPSLAQFGPRMKDLVLPLGKADYDADAENGPSREDEGKSAASDEKKDPSFNVTGELYVSVAWKFPIYEEKNLDREIGAWLDELDPTGNFHNRYRDKIADKFVDLKSLAQLHVSVDGKVSEEFFKIVGIDKKNRHTFEEFFKSYASESVKDRAEIQEKLHTGMLTLRIDRARNLRRTEAKKFRDCDPQVFVWLRNDKKGAWRKRCFMKTRVVGNSRNPKWEHEQQRELMLGSFEARFKEPEEGWTGAVKKAFTGRTQRRHNAEDRQAAALKSYGQGLQVKFRDVQDGRSSGGGEGENHKVEVYLNDSIHECKAKLQLACQREAAFWRKRGEEDKAMKYTDVTVGHRHLVMVFMPPPKVQRLLASKQNEGEEYRRAYFQAQDDPSSWLPLDPARSFAQYPRFGFGQRQTQMLRVVEATESYKTHNLRYKIYEEELSKRGFRDMDEPERCFGWAKYVHRDDSDSVEWRPAFVSKNETGGTAFRVKWVFEQGRGSDRAVSSSAAPHQAEDLVPMDRASVLLALRCPKFDDEVHPDHKELLEQAKVLRGSGKSDFEVEMVLNRLLESNWQAKKREVADLDESARPPRITVDIIRGYMQRRQEQDTKAAEARTNAAGAVKPHR